MQEDHLDHHGNVVFEPHLHGSGTLKTRRVHRKSRPRLGIHVNYGIMIFPLLRDSLMRDHPPKWSFNKDYPLLKDLSQKRKVFRQ